MNITKRVSKGGRIAFLVRVKWKRKVYSSTHDRLTDARRWGAMMEADLRAGRYVVKQDTHKVVELIDRYIQAILSHNSKNARTRTTQLLWWRERIGQYDIAKVTPQLIAQCRDELVLKPGRNSEPISISTVNHYLKALSHAFTIAQKEWGWIESSPMRNVRKLKEPRGRVRFLSDEERDALLGACKQSDNPYLYTIVVLALSTGARKGELMGLKWCDVSFERSTIVLHETKNGERRLLPLTGYALDLVRHLERCYNGRFQHIFPSPDHDRPIDIRSAWEVALSRSGITDFRFHDLRHSAASYLAMNGASLMEIAEVLGHKTLSMVKRYSHLSNAHTTSVVQRMNDKIFKSG